MSNYKIYKLTEIGIDHEINREENQDTFMIFETSFMNSERALFLVVADGMGAMADSKNTSKNAVEGFSKGIYELMFQHFLDHATREVSVEILENMMREAIKKANQLAFERRKSRNHAIGTTLSVVCIYRNSVIIAHTGDSPIYRYHKSSNEMVLVSQNHRTAWGVCGIGDKTLKDEYIYSEILDKLKDGDMMLVGSDGAFGNMSEDEIREVIVDSGNEREALNRLFESAKNKGSSDDQTAVLYKKCEDDKYVNRKAIYQM